MNNWKDDYLEKLVTPEQVVLQLKSGDRVVIGHAQKHTNLQ